MSTDDEEAVIAASREFYRAFASGDLEAMDALWSRERPVACIHPGGPVLATRDLILDSWASILRDPDRPAIRAQKVKVFLLGETAFVTCYERVLDGCLAASSVFAREGEAWKLVLHQAGPGPARLMRTRQEQPLLLH